MWERPKTQYDYARFFNEWYSKDIASFVRRDRNHSCILFWSIGNEISDTHADEKRGQEVFPPDAMEQEFYFAVVNDAGIESHLAKVEFSGNQAKVTALGDGAFRLRCIAKNGTVRAKVISQLEFTAEGLGQAYLDPYQFIAGGMYTWHEGKAGNGNEHGVSTSVVGRTIIGYEGIDFESFGSDRITSYRCIS